MSFDQNALEEKRNVYLLRLWNAITSRVFWQGVAGVVGFFVIWQLVRSIGWLSVLPTPVELAAGIPAEISKPGYWEAWVNSSGRVFGGFIIAAFSGIVLGALMGMSWRLRSASFPVLEILRPIPPVAWLPIALLVWPTAEMTMMFLTFLGAFFPIFLNVLTGIDNVDQRHIQAAQSLGSNRWAMFRRILVPGALPSLFTGLAIAIGITWEVVIAAEMAAGSNGLGYMTWDAYMAHSMVGIVLGMISIGIAGMASSWLMKVIGDVATPWQRGH